MAVGTMAAIVLWFFAAHSCTRARVIHFCILVYLAVMASGKVVFGMVVSVGKAEKHTGTVDKFSLAHNMVFLENKVSGLVILGNMVAMVCDMVGLGAAGMEVADNTDLCS